MEEYGVGILGVGRCLPEKVLTNFDLEKMVDTSDEWITKRTGISERRILREDEPAYKMGVTAALSALQNANIKAEDIDLIVVTTSTPDYLCPPTSCLIQNEIGAFNAATMDLNAACSGFTYALDLAYKYIKSGLNKNILLIGCEALSKAVDWEDRNTCVLFGDAAGATVVGRVETGYGIRQTHLGADGTKAKVLTIPNCFKDQEQMEKRNGKHIQTIWMDGGEVFKFAVRVMGQATLQVLEQEGISMDQVKLVVPHQANIRIIDAAKKRLEIGDDKIHTILHKYGNISSASIPVALSEAVDEGKLNRGDYVVFVAFGGGLTWGATLVKWQ